MPAVSLRGRVAYPRLWRRAASACSEINRRKLTIGSMPAGRLANRRLPRITQRLTFHPGASLKLEDRGQFPGAAGYRLADLETNQAAPLQHAGYFFFRHA
jgi:hypothetical protein